MTECLDLHQLTVTHRGTPLVDVADVRMEPGRPLTIVGESGSGKSLLAHALMGTLAPELGVEGTMSIGDRSFPLAEQRSRRPLWGRELALLPQEPALALDPTMRVRPQVAEGIPAAPSRRHADDAARRALRGMGLGHVERSFPHTLSGGMAQRVAFAAATVGGARVLIVDEPSKGLDSSSLDRLAELLDEHVGTGGLLLTITHDLGLARRLGGDVMVMRQASIVERGAADRVLTVPDHEYTRRLLAAEPARWRHDWMRRDRAVEPGPPLLTADSISKAYGPTPLFEDLSLEIRAGERWSLTGPSGSGKTALGNALLRLVPVDRGSVLHASGLSGGRAQKLYQDPTTSFPARVRLGLGVRDVMRRYGARPERLDALMAAVGLPEDLLDRRSDQVSGGELQRLAIVRAMLVRPNLVVADEATSRLDLVTQETTVACLMSELADHDCALLLITHDPALAATVADRQLTLPGSADTRARGRFDVLAAAGTP